MSERNEEAPTADPGWRLRLKAMTAHGLARITGSRRWWRTTAHLRLKLGELDGAQQALERHAQADQTPPPSKPWFEVAEHAEQLGELETAATALNRTIELDPEKVGRRLALARVQASAGDHREAAATLAGAAAIEPARHDELIHRQVAQLQLAGEWERVATLVLNAGHDISGDLHEELARALIHIHRWGGSLRAVDDHLVRIEPPAPHGDLGGLDLLARAEQAASTASELLPDRPGLLYLAASLRLDLERPQAAIPLLERAVGAARRTSSLWGYRALHRWQFALEQAHAATGSPRVDDPLFAATIEPTETPDNAAATFPGVVHASFVYTGLRISGVVFGPQPGPIDLTLDGELLRRLNVSVSSSRAPFSFTIQREALDHFPTAANLEVIDASGTPLLHSGGGPKWKVSIPHGDASLPNRLQEHGGLDKKGGLRPTPAESQARQEAYLDLYGRAQHYFSEVLGRPLLLLYGTLLGYHRDGDLIPGDDDFDAGYLSDASAPPAVKAETLEIIGSLTQAGFTVTFNRRGRLFRLADSEAAATGVHLDVRPIWFEGGNVWLHNHASFPSSPERFIPPATGELRGRSVLVPADTQHFLRAHYGSEWRTPDPAFTYHPEDIDPATQRHLADALLRPNEYTDALDVLEQRDPAAAARFISIGLRDLYDEHGRPR